MPLADASVTVLAQLPNIARPFVPPGPVQREALDHFAKLCDRLLGPSADIALREATALVRGCERPAYRALVLSVAQVAVVADERIVDREELALRQLCELLGFDPNCG